MMRIAVIDYPGLHGVSPIVSQLQAPQTEVYTVWHQSQRLEKPDLIVIPSGYSFAHYLRPGSLAKVSPISGALRKFALDGGSILGIGNGFHILCELGLLPGICLQNSNGEFIQKEVFLRVESTQGNFLKNFKYATILKAFLASSHARYYTDARTLNLLEEKELVAFRYSNDEGETENPPGSLQSIAGVMNEDKNLLGLMANIELPREMIC